MPVMLVSALLVNRARSAGDNKKKPKIIEMDITVNKAGIMRLILFYKIDEMRMFPFLKIYRYVR